jgi:hypothetical protein
MADRKYCKCDFLLEKAINIIRNSCIGHKHATRSTADWSGTQPKFDFEYVLCMQCQHSIDSIIKSV